MAQRKRSRIFKKMPKYLRQKARRVNKIINAWDAAGLTSNDLELAKDLLSDFYENTGKTVKETQLASEEITLKRSEKEEYNKILDFILYNDEVDLSRRTLKNQMIRQQWENSTFNEVTYEKVKDQFDQVYDEQSFIDFVDRMNKTKNNRVLSHLLDSDQFAELYESASNNNIKETEINNWMVKMYEGTGAQYDELFGQIQRLIKRVSKRRNNKKG